MTSDPTKLSAVHTIPQSLLINVLGISYELWLTISLQKIECPMLLYKNASLLLEPLCRQVVGTWWCIMLRVEYYVGSHYEVRHFSSCLMGNPRHFMITQRQQQQSLQCHKHCLPFSHGHSLLLPRRFPRSFAPSNMEYLLS